MTSPPVGGEGPRWPDAALAACGLAFAVGPAAVLLDPGAAVPLAASAPTAAACLLAGAAMLRKGLRGGAFAQLALAVGWAAVALARRGGG